MVKRNRIDLYLHIHCSLPLAVNSDSLDVLVVRPRPGATFGIRVGFSAALVVYGELERDEKGSALVMVVPFVYPPLFPF